MNVAQIRSDLADSLSEVVRSTATHRTQPLNGFPAAIINIDTITPDSFGDATGTVSAIVQVLVSKADSPEAWTTLDDLLSDDSIGSALRECPSVSNVGSYEQIGSEIEYDDGVALGFIINVEVFA